VPSRNPRAVPRSCAIDHVWSQVRPAGRGEGKVRIPENPLLAKEKEDNAGLDLGSIEDPVGRMG
jgi:hypothetical protein